MARGPTKRVVLNRQALTQVGLAVAEGMAAVGREILDVAEPPDSPFEPYPLGEGLPKQGGLLAYFEGKKIDGYGQDGKQPKKPRAADVKRGVTVVVGWGFPARFNEFGTVDTPAQPFASPAVERVTPRAVEIMRPVVAAKLGRMT
jgi:hypothetical protein